MIFEKTVGIRTAMNLIMLDLGRTYQGMKEHTFDREYVDIFECFGMDKHYRYIDYNGVTVDCKYNADDYTVTFTYEVN